MMTAGTSVSSRSAATKRLMKEYAELQSSPNYQYTAAPLEDNMFDWHFTIRGPEDSEFENGIYHGRIVLPPQYPYKPPSIYFLTPNGRFELGKKICLSITGYHPETWLPAWGIRTALIALISFMTTEGKDAVGALDYSPKERRILAKKSQSWHCQQCGCKNCEQLLPIPKNESKTEEDDKKLAEMLVVSHEKKETNNSDSENQTNDIITSTDDVNNKINNNESILPLDNINNNKNNNNNNSNVINSTSSTIPNNLTNINIPNTNINANLIHNTNFVQVNASSIQQRKPMNSSIPNSTVSPVTSTSSNTSQKIVNSSTSATSSQTNLNNNNTNNSNDITTTIHRQNNNNNEERFKSLIDTAIIVVFSLLAFLLYYRSTKDSKFWKDLD